MMIIIIVIELIVMAKNPEREIFVSYLKQKGLRNTKQREEILDAFLTSDGHITVEELYHAVTKKDHGIGYATVHRNLNLLRECGLAEEIKIGNQRTKFETPHGQGHHDHLICLKCGRLIEVNDEKIERLQVRLAETNNFTPVRHKLEIYGYCNKCR